MKTTTLRKNLTMAILIAALAVPVPMVSQTHRGNDRPNRIERPAGNRPAPDRPAQRPGNNRPAPDRPAQRPGNNRPAPGRPAQRPGNNRPAPGRPQQRPNRPAPAPPRHQRPPHNWHRPVPPPARRYRVPRPMPHRPRVLPWGYRPYVHAPAIRSILGITFGTLYGSALDYLFNNGYTIDGYADNTIYLSDVILLNQSWPFASLYCNANGQFTSAQFSYYSSYNNLNRYNLIYNLLCNSYGTPLSLSASGIARRVMWYGGGGTGYVTLEFDYYDGSYHTVLSVSR